MKYQAKTLRTRPWLNSIVLITVLLYVHSASWCCATASAETLAGLSSAAADRYSSTSLSDSVPQGIARPSHRATMSAPLQGVLVELLVRDGVTVEKGQILAVMDNRIAKMAVQASEAAAQRTAAIEHAKHALDLAHSLFSRHVKLQQSQAGAEFELEQARVQLKQAEATLASAREEQLQAKRNLALEEARLESHNLRAPFNGRVVHVAATVGTTLTSTDNFLTIVNLDSLEAELFLPLELFKQLQEGKSYSLWAFAPLNRTIQAKLVFASPTIDPATKTFRCKFKIDNRNRKLPAGFAVRFNSSLH
jgi:RND family efflux transporter MFP subunit